MSMLATTGPVWTGWNETRSGSEEPAAIAAPSDGWETVTTPRASEPVPENGIFDGPAVDAVLLEPAACGSGATSTPSTVTGPVTVTLRVAETGRSSVRVSPSSTEPASTAPACTGAAAEEPNAISWPLRAPT